MHIGTLNRYLAGREMKAGAMIELAEATGVRLEWLATGRGPMREGEQAPPASERTRAGASEAAPEPFRLFGRVKIDRLVDAYQGALASTRGQDPRLTMHLMLVLYDQLTEAAEAEGKG